MAEPDGLPHESTPHNTPADTSGCAQPLSVSTGLYRSVPSDSTRPTRYSIFVDVNAGLFDHSETPCYRYIGPAELTWHDEDGVKHMAVSLKLAAKKSDAMIPICPGSSEIRITNPAPALLNYHTIPDCVNPPAPTPSQPWHKEALKDAGWDFIKNCTEFFNVEMNEGKFVARGEKMLDAAVENSKAAYYAARKELGRYVVARGLKRR